MTEVHGINLCQKTNQHDAFLKLNGRLMIKTAVDDGIGAEIVL